MRKAIKNFKNLNCFTVSDDVSTLHYVIIKSKRVSTVFLMNLKNLLTLNFRTKCHSKDFVSISFRFFYIF